MGTFEFVLVNDTDRNEKVKNHLRQRQSALRRSKLKEWRQASAALKSSSIVAKGPLAFRRKDSLEDASESSGDDGRRRSSSLVSLATTPTTQNSPGRSNQLAQITITQVFEHPSPDFVASPTGSVMTNDPLSLIGTARNDPFHSYPIQGNREVDELFDFYVHELGPRTFQYTSNPNHDIFRCHASISLSDPAAFHALLIMAAINRDRLAGRSLPGVRALFHRVEAIRLINERLDSPDPEIRLSESTIYAVTRIEVVEKQWNAVGEAEIHMPGLQQLLIQKGGIEVLAQQHPQLELVLYATAVVIPRMLQAGSPALYNPDRVHFSMQEEERALGGALMNFLTEVSTNARHNSDMFSQLAFAFSPGRAMHELLASPTPFPPNYSPALSTRKFIAVAEMLRMSILLYIHCVLMNLTSQTHFVDLVDHLHWLNGSEWIWKRSLRMLHYLLVKDEDSARLSDSAIAWQVLRLGSGTCLLSPAACGMIRTYLLGLLSGTQTIPLGLDWIRSELSGRGAYQKDL